MTNSSGLLYFQTHHAEPGADWILFVHGAGGSTRTWRRQVESFQKEYNLLMVDLPGHGHSDEVTRQQRSYDFVWIANKIWEVVDHLNIKRLHLVAVSLGSIIGMQMHHNRPQALKSMVFAGPIVALNTKLRILASSALFLAKIIGFQNFYALTARVTLPRKNHKKSREVFVKESKRIADDEYRKWTSMYGATLDTTLSSLFSSSPGLPLYFVIGDQDHLFKQPALRFATKYNDVSVQLVPSCGHLVSLEKSDIFNEKCLSFFSKRAVLDA